MPRQVDLREHLLQLTHDPTQQLTPDVGLEKMANGLAELLLKIPEMLRAEIQRVIETLLGIAANPIAALEEWVQGIPVLSQIVAALTGIPGGIAQLAQAFKNLRDFLRIDINVADFDPIAAAKHFATSVVQPFIQIASRIRAALLGPLPIGLLTDRLPTLLMEGGFDDPITIVEGSGFTHDATDGVPGTTPLGCARVECDGTHRQIATEIQEVGPGWTLEIAGYIKHQGLVAGADAIRLNVIPYVDENTPAAGGPIMVATAGAASGDSVGIDGWRLLPIKGAWTVPATGISHVAIECHVTDSATGGVVKFDEITLHATQKIPQGFTKDLPQDLTSLWNWLGSLVDQLLAGLGVTPEGGLLDKIFDLSDELEWIQSKAQEVGEEIQNGWNKFWGRVFGVPNATGKSSEDFAEAAQLIVDYVRQGADGTDSTEGEMADAKSAVDGLRQTVAALQSKLSQLLARDPQSGGGAPGVVGNVATDEAERPAHVGWGPGWIIPPGFNVNGVATDGHRWVWNDSGNSQRTTPGIYTATPTLTPYQSVQFVMASLMERPGWGGPGNPSNWIIFRSNVTGTQFAFIKVLPSTVQLWKYDNGTFTQVLDSFSATPAVGARWEVRAGTAAGVDTIVLLMNDRGVANWTPDPGVIWSDAAHQFAGQAMQSDNRNLGEATPGSIEVWTLSDNAPDGTVGTGLIVTSSNTTGRSLPTGASRVPSGFFDVTEHESADIVWDGQKATVRDAGWYSVQAEIAMSTGATGAMAVLYRQGIPWKVRRSGSPITATASVGGSWNIYLPEGGECGPGVYVAGSSGAIVGDAATQATWFSITRLN